MLSVSHWWKLARGKMEITVRIVSCLPGTCTVIGFVPVKSRILTNDKGKGGGGNILAQRTGPWQNFAWVAHLSHISEIVWQILQPFLHKPRWHSTCYQCILFSNSTGGKCDQWWCYLWETWDLLCCNNNNGLERALSTDLLSNSSYLSPGSPKKQPVLLMCQAM